MAPKTKFSNKEKGKGKASVSATASPLTYPWPRPEGEPFDIDRAGLPHSSPDSWDEINAFYYNQLLQVNLEPTRFMCDRTLVELGLQQQVRSILYNARCMAFALEEDVLYPDLTRQCLATATLSYANPDSPCFEEATFSFFAGGKRYAISMFDFCVAYGFYETDTRLSGPKRFQEAKSFWSLIASGEYSSNSASQNRLRHPALRIVARILSNMLFGRAVGNKVHQDELLLLLLGCGPIVGEGDSAQYERYRSNLGIRFAEMISAIKDNATTTSKGPRTEHIGSLLTPLFRHLRVDLSESSYVPEMRRINMEHLLLSKIIIKPQTYQFLNGNGESSYIELPNLALTRLSTLDDLAFDPPPHYLVPNPSRASNVSRRSISRRSTSRQPQLDSEDAGPSVPRLALPYHDTPSQGEFDLPPINDDANDVEYKRWMIQSTKKNNSLLQRLMQALSKGCCHVPETETQRAPARSERAPARSHSSTDQPARRRRRTDDDGDDTTSG